MTRRLGDVSITCGLGLQYSDLAGGGGISGGIIISFFLDAGCSVAVCVIEDHRTGLWQDFAASPTVPGDLLVNIIV